MEMTRGASPPSPIHIHAPSPSSARRPSEQHGPPPGWHPRHSLPTPMTIPGSTRGREPPPPLPPPRYLHNHAAGSDDPGWSWSNPHRGGFDKSRPSNVIASQHPRPWTDLLDDDEIAPDQVSARRRQSSSATVHSMKDSDRRYDAGLDEGYYSLSVTSSANPQLHGERQLHHRGQERSLQAYDNKLLSKIGKPSTPPGTGAFNGAESSPTSSLTFGRQPIPSQLRSLSFPNSITSAYSESPVKREPLGRYGESPRSRPISPGTIPSSSTLQSLPEHSSPTLDHSRRSSGFGGELHSAHPHRLQRSRRSLGGPGPGSGFSDPDESAVPSKNTISLPTRPVKRESYDHHSIFSEPESSTFRVEETVKQLHLEDRKPFTSHRDALYRNPLPTRPLHPSHSMSGIKRKQMASPPEPTQDEMQAQLLQQTANTASQYTQQNASHLTASHYPPPHGSISSQSSTGFRNGSYASSGGPSVAGTSYTSIDQHSPEGISPSEQSHQYQPQLPSDASYNPSLSLDPTAHAARGGPYPDPQDNLEPYGADANLPRKTNENPARRNNAPNIPSSPNICQCCPKKPKKFETPEELRQHESEKQYRCQYCNNRFKNKNEAERHQNSLHLRRHSWSCAALAASYDSAFFLSSDVLPPPNNVGQSQPAQSAFDLCGYCGEQFPNNPSNWDERTKHLDQVHKYRECNQSKKFYRADHFRQHLKHSHGGTSGKWTTRLEQACIKDEPAHLPMDSHGSANPQTPSAPVANMGGLPQPDMTVSPMAPPNTTQYGMAQQSTPSGSMHQGHPSSAQQGMPQVDMTNIDPNIGAPHMANAALVSSLGGMGPPQ